ncbi:hypothetical protein GCM10027074_66200 [Streptomyces deserti]
MRNCRTPYDMQHYEPADSVSTCYVLTDDVDGLGAADERGHAPPPRARRDLRAGPAPRRAPRDSKEDPAAAAKVVDRVLNLEEEKPTRVQLLQPLVLRADIAGRLGDEETAASALTRAAAVRLTADERDRARDALVRLADLRAGARS